jgi:hypothetical protein
VTPRQSTCSCREEDARRALEAMLLDEPDWAGQFYVQPVELDEQNVSAN